MKISEIHKKKIYQKESQLIWSIALNHRTTTNNRTPAHHTTPNQTLLQTARVIYILHWWVIKKEQIHYLHNKDSTWEKNERPSIKINNNNSNYEEPSSQRKIEQTESKFMTKFKSWITKLKQQTAKIPQKMHS